MLLTTVNPTTANIIGAIDEVIAHHCSEAQPTPWQELELELQLALFESPGYSLPDPEHLARLARRQIKRRPSAKFATSHENVPDADLFERVAHVHARRGRGISASDWSAQRELEARSAGVGLLRALPNVELSRVYGGRELHRGVARARIVRALQIADAQGWLGFYGSGERLADALGFDAATWWRAVAWLEARGWLVRLRTYKSGKHSRTPIDLSRNWYGPGPRLLRWRDVYRSELSEDRALFLSVARACRVSWHREAAAGCLAPMALGMAAVALGKLAAYQEHRAERVARMRAGEPWAPDDPENHAAGEAVELEALELAALPGHVVELATLNRGARRRSPLCEIAARTFAAASIEPRRLYAAAKCIKTPVGGDTHELDRSPPRRPTAAAGPDSTGSQCSSGGVPLGANSRDEGGSAGAFVEKWLSRWRASLEERARDGGG